mmetsp:Transcript_34146/g.67205  ORF Transcript_34146/g.67205 Transcript_34146/m.67205 type:complete len:120 (+) Transcript_34146:695-1054(+)
MAAAIARGLTVVRTKASMRLTGSLAPAVSHGLTAAAMKASGAMVSSMGLVRLKQALTENLDRAYGRMANALNGLVRKNSGCCCSLRVRWHSCNVFDVFARHFRGCHVNISWCTLAVPML